MQFEVVKFVDKRLTTLRDAGRHEDFFLPEGTTREVEARKHFGDHEYDSGTTVELDRTYPTLFETLYAAAQKFHSEF
jgi:hypothetical protein